MPRQLAFDLHDLQVFVDVAETGSMTTAARRGRMTQSAVSQVVKQLERRLSRVLVDRRRRPLCLTPSGRLLYETARSLLDEAHRLPRLVQGGPGAPRIMRLGLVDSLATPFVSHLVKAMEDEVVSLSIWSGLSVAQTTAFLGRELDMIIASDPLEEVDSLERHTLLSEPYVLALPRACAGSPAASDLVRLSRELPLIRSSPRSQTGGQVDRHLRRLRLDIPRRFEFDSSETISSMVAAGMGFAILTPLCLSKTPQHLTGIAIAPFPGPGFSRELTLIARRGEFGRLPARLAQLARRIIRRQYLSELRTLAPWLEDRVTVS